MNIDDTADVDESPVVIPHTTRLGNLFEHFRKRKLIWIIVFIILIVAIIAIPTITVTVNKGKREKTSTMQITTAEIVTATSTTEKPTQITTTTEEFIPSVIINENTKWKQSAITVAGGSRAGAQLYQLATPYGIYLDDDSRSIYIADTGNHRIVRWEFDARMGEFVAGESGIGLEIDNLYIPVNIILDKEKTSLIICDEIKRRVIRWPLEKYQDIELLISHINCFDLAMDNNGDLYISNSVEHQVRRLQHGDKASTIVAGGNGQGNKLNQFNRPMYIYVDEYYSIYVADYANNRVMKWMKDATEGILVVSGEASRENPNSLMQPIGVIVDHMGNIYVSSEGNHQITRWSPGAIEGVPVVGEKQYGSGPTQLFFPTDLLFDRQGNLYVADTRNHRIQKFIIDRD